MARVCHHCGAEHTGDRKVGRQETCLKCGSSLHVCLNCRFYDTTRHNHCAEPVAERVVDKRKLNFCDYFEFGEGRGGGGGAGRKSRLDEQIKGLFKD